MLVLKCDRKTPQLQLDGCVGTFSSLHPGGLQVCLVDGAVRFVSDMIESAEEVDIDALASIQSGASIYKVWQAICVIDDGIPVGDY